MVPVYLEDDNQKFNRILRVSFVCYFILGITVALIHVELPVQRPEEVPRRVAKLIPKPVVKPPAPVKAEPETKKDSQPAPAEPEAKKERPKPAIEVNKEIVKKAGLLAAMINAEASGKLDEMVENKNLARAFSNPKLITSSRPSKEHRAVSVSPLGRTGEADKTVAGLGKVKDEDLVALKGKQQADLSISDTTGLGGGGTGQGSDSGAMVRVKGGSGSGGIDYDAIARVVEKYKKGILYLYNRELRTDPTLKGTITVEFSIDANGKVIEARVVSTTMEYPVMEDALEKRILQWQFPKLYDGVIVVTYPFVFFPV
jgi:TonB family protein